MKTIYLLLIATSLFAGRGGNADNIAALVIGTLFFGMLAAIADTKNH